MSNPRPGSAGTASRGGRCIECVRKREEGHRSAREPEFCPRHQCDQKDASGVMCATRKKAADIRCPAHTECTAHHCSNPRTVDAQGKPNAYCCDHTCAVENCREGKVHDPRRKIYDALCATHLLSKCDVANCIGWKSGTSRYCESHVCFIEDCISKVMSESRPFCLDHNACRVQGCMKERCQFGNQFESVCLDHYIAPCASKNGCNLKSSTPSSFCELHACQRRNCLREAKPDGGKPFCIDHKCTITDCQAICTFRDENGKLKRNDFCSFHECQTDKCVKLTDAGKPYCNSHCCTELKCKSARDGHSRFGSICYAHHESGIRDAAILTAERRLEEERLRREEDARAEEARRRAVPPHRRREDNPLPHRQRDDIPHRPREDPRPRGRGIPDPRRYEELRPGMGYEDAYEDEGYRSRPNSGTYGRG